MQQAYTMMRLALLLFALPLLLNASYTIKEGTIVESEYESTQSMQEHYGALIEAYQEEDWQAVVHQGLVLTKNFPESFFAEEALFYLGVGQYHVGEYDWANKALSKYLKAQSTPKFFETAITYKFKIAEKFREGERTRLFGLKGFPKWISEEDTALELYDEVIAALPQHDLCAEALYSKARLLLAVGKYQASLEAFGTLAERFLKHPLAVQAYLGIADVFLEQCRKQYPDQDFLDLAEINLRKFKEDFPTEERIDAVAQKIEAMKEVYAKQLYTIAQFYERTKRLPAAVIYYKRLIHKYPTTHFAAQAQKALTSKRLQTIAS